MVFCNVEGTCFAGVCNKVTILILIDGFLQYCGETSEDKEWERHNPYFNRWFSAI